MEKDDYLNPERAPNDKQRKAGKEKIDKKPLATKEKMTEHAFLKEKSLSNEEIEKLQESAYKGQTGKEQEIHEERGLSREGRIRKHLIPLYRTGILRDIEEVPE